MKLLLVMMVCAVAAAAPKVKQVESFDLADLFQNESIESRNLVINALVRRLMAFLRLIINNGSEIFGIPPLDPLELDHFHLVVPAGLINLDLDLKNIRATGMGGFRDDRAALDLREMTFDLDIVVPFIDISAGSYDLIGDLFTAVPLYGKGEARFQVEDFRFTAILHLIQSDDGRSILIDRISSPSFAIPKVKSEITGAIGGGNIDAIVNAMIEEVIMDYINRFQGAISLLAGSMVKNGLNPILEKLDTWKYIAPLIPRN